MSLMAPVTKRIEFPYCFPDIGILNIVLSQDIEILDIEAVLRTELGYWKRNAVSKRKNAVVV